MATEQWIERRIPLVGEASTIISPERRIDVVDCVKVVVAGHELRLLLISAAGIVTDVGLSSTSTRLQKGVRKNNEQ